MRPIQRRWRNSVCVEVVQHPVGQGGLFCGTLRVGADLLRWAYDCGSNNIEMLNREIRRIANEGELDLLFLSHLDSDHVNGVDRLLTATSTTEVVLPYLGEKELSLTIARDLGENGVTGAFLEFAESPARWFFQRGVQRVSFIGGSDSSDTATGLDGEPPESPDTPLSEGERYRYKWSEPPWHTQDYGRQEVRFFNQSAYVLIPDEHDGADWILWPYAHQPSNTKIELFRYQFQNLFGRDVSIPAVREIIRDGRKRELLRECYDEIWRDHNLVSMALYSGPERRNACYLSIYGRDSQTGGDQEIDIDTFAVGWLGTGDSDLSGHRRRTEFLAHYGHILPNVSVFVVPHHGSGHSFASEIVHAMPNLQAGVAAAGTDNAYRHPHRVVVDAFHGRRTHFFQVSENPTTEAGSYIVFRKPRSNRHIKLKRPKS